MITNPIPPRPIMKIVCHKRNGTRSGSTTRRIIIIYYDNIAYNAKTKCLKTFHSQFTIILIISIIIPAAYRPRDYNINTSLVVVSPVEKELSRRCYYYECGSDPEHLKSVCHTILGARKNINSFPV